MFYFFAIKKNETVFQNLFGKTKLLVYFIFTLGTVSYLF